MGSATGAAKTAAARIGTTVEEYQQHINAGQKWCGRCRAWHPTTAFGKDRSRSDGLASSCLDSRVAKKSGQPSRRERRLRLAVGERWCRGCQQWLPAAEVRQGVCRTHAAQQYREYYARNPHGIRSRATARARGLEPTPGWWRQDAFARFQGRCGYGCGQPATALDHIFPVVQGGQSRPGNLVPACKPCNSSKKDRDPWPWIGRGMAAFPAQWVDIIALDLETAGYLEVS